MRSPGAYVVLVLALVITSRRVPEARVRTASRDVCAVTHGTTAPCAKRVEVPAPGARKQAKDTKLQALPREAVALAEPERHPSFEHVWSITHDGGASAVPRRGARAPPHS